ncbi:N-acetylmuramoyl-L-alanine amidase [Winogradskyella sp. PG-2]|uniref:N-acetylmuramoyl-L-alanine amidase family protein n=1 Tax=Winogradskyella sp. PG-2 TaxID=754409 RepID=UPI000458850E|nr:N-acetylmuramoyl-L-alanine amidase [Winogradskyella sp. PG-2]BAO77238.1 N-acetylmuramoyl-L-alanine amidase [Winogradskyella sp. PG-2]
MQTKSKYIIVCLLVTFITTLTSYGTLYAQDDNFVVVLDAGHGGKDPGAMKNGYKEKKIALDVVLKLGKTLEEIDDIKVIYTRKTDKFIELWRRADIANKADADLFISIHCNSVNNSKPFGTETWVLGEKNTTRNFEVAKRENEVIFLEDNYEENYEGFNPSSPESTIAIGIEQEVYIEQSITLAGKIENNFVNKAKRKSRGLKQHSLLVIRNTYMPSILVELGFISNKKEGAFLNSKPGQSKMSNALKDAILDYKKELDQNVGTHILGEDLESPSIEVEEPKIIEDVIFKVQIAASKNDLAPKSYNFKGLSDISKNKVGDRYRYYYGNTLDYTKAQELKEEAKAKGYSTSFIVAYKDGKQIDVSDALKSASN